jgi:hypothetical protein
VISPTSEKSRKRNITRNTAPTALKIGPGRFRGKARAPKRSPTRNNTEIRMSSPRLALRNATIWRKTGVWT